MFVKENPDRKKKKNPSIFIIKVITDFNYVKNAGKAAFNLFEIDLDKLFESTFNNEISLQFHDI